MNRVKEKGMKMVFLIAACTSVLAVLLICIFLFANGLPTIAQIEPESHPSYRDFLAWY